MRIAYFLMIVACIMFAVKDACRGDMVMCALMLLCALANMFNLMNYLDKNGGTPA